MAEFEDTPPTLRIAAYSPDGKSGSRRFAWARPTNPGANPEKITSAGMPPTVAVVAASACDKPSIGAIAPVATAGSTAPCPVKYTEITDPTAAGLSVELGVKS